MSREVKSTADTMEKILDIMQDCGSVTDWINSLDEFERASVHELLRASEDFVQVMRTNSLDLSD